MGVSLLFISSLIDGIEDLHASNSVPGLKIAQVATTDVSISLLLRDQIEALQSEGHEVTAICAPGSRVDWLRGQGIPVHTVQMSREVSPVQDLRSLLELSRYFRSQRFDAVHTHTPKAGLLGPLAARLAGVPLVVHTIHGLLYHDGLSRWKQLLFWFPEKMTSLCCHDLLSQSREDIEVALRTWLCSAGKIHYLGNGIDVDTFSPDAVVEGRGVPWVREREDIIIGSVGRLVYEKGFAELFQAVEQLVPRHPNLKFVVVGPEEKDQNDAVERDRMDHLEERGLVRFVGWQADMPSVYAGMDLLVLPSHREGIPRACMEASSMGLPIIATDIRGSREVVLNGRTGLLVPVRDPVALQKAIEEMLQRREEWGRMGRQAREHIVENFNSRLVLRRLCNFYADAARRKSESGRFNQQHSGH